MRWDLAVIGAGAAGILAATRAAERGKKTLLLEKNNKPGVKILISGGSRCNITHNTDARGIIEAYGRQGRFLHSALAALGPSELIAIIENEGVATKIEPTGKIFPASDRSVDVLEALLKRFRRSGAVLALGDAVLDLDRSDEGFRLRTEKAVIETEKVLITTGGVSYPGCGTTGDGYRWAERFGHTIVTPRPALVPITVQVPWIVELKGVTLPDVAVRIDDTTIASPKKAVLARRRSSLLFAHFGLTGPAALDVSREVSGRANPRELCMIIDFLPDIAANDIDEWLRVESLAAGKKHLAAVLAERIPRRIAETLLARSELDVERKAAALSKTDRARLTQSIKELRIPVTGTMGFKKAEVTAGGVSLAEVDSSTMQSKLVPNLHLAGEVLDLDGPIGGFNFQAAFSTGWLAAESV